MKKLASNKTQDFVIDLSKEASRQFIELELKIIKLQYIYLRRGESAAQYKKKLGELLRKEYKSIIEEYKSGKNLVKKITFKEFDNERSKINSKRNSQKK